MWSTNTFGRRKSTCRRGNKFRNLRKRLFQGPMFCYGSQIVKTPSPRIYFLFNLPFLVNPSPSTDETRWGKRESISPKTNLTRQRLDLVFN